MDVIYDEKEGDDEKHEEEEEEDGVDLDTRVLPLAPTAALQVDEAKVLLNLCRCYLKSPLGRLVEALKAVSGAIAILEEVVVSLQEQQQEEGEEERERLLQLLVSAYDIRCKALCRGGWFQTAKKDVKGFAIKYVTSSSSSFNSSSNRGTRREKVKEWWQYIETAIEQRQKADRRLVKSMSRFIDGAVRSSSSSSSTGDGAAAAAGPPEEAGCVCS